MPSEPVSETVRWLRGGSDAPSELRVFDRTAAERARIENERRQNRRKRISMVMFKAHNDEEEFRYSLWLHRQRVEAEEAFGVRWTEQQQHLLRLATRGPVATDLEELQ